MVQKKVKNGNKIEEVFGFLKQKDILARFETTPEGMFLIVKAKIAETSRVSSSGKANLFVSGQAWDKQTSLGELCLQVQLYSKTEEAKKAKKEKTIYSTSVRW